MVLILCTCLCDHSSPHRFVLNSQTSADLMDHFTNRLKWLPLEQRTSTSSSDDNGEEIRQLENYLSVLGNVQVYNFPSIP